MAYTGMGPEIRLPELPERPWGRFIDVVPQLDVTVDGTDRTPMGARWMAEAAYSPIIQDFDCEALPAEEVEKQAGNLVLGETTSAAFLSFNLFECSTLSGDMGPFFDYVQRTFDSLVSEALAWAATHALTGDHLNLAANSTNLGASDSTVEAIARIESGLAQRISNKRGYVFIPVRRLAEAVSDGAVFLSGGQYVTPAGHFVISDAGHNNDGTFYGTGALGYSVTNPQDLSGPEGQIDITRNTRRWLRENYGLIAFNPNHSVRTVHAFAESL